MKATANLSEWKTFLCPIDLIVAYMKQYQPTSIVVSVNVLP